MKHEDEDESLAERTRALVAGMSYDDLSYLLGRYCGPYNRFLSDKKFGFTLNERVVREALTSMDFERAFFNDDISD